jgi:A/G-specific adenine glycosylase
MEVWFSEGLSTWYRKNKRDLPWRNTRNPYQIWLSEIILQQTQVIQGLSYYNRFLEAFPTVKHLASASEDEVLKLWQGLGYYSRARNLHGAAKHIMAAHKGVFPKQYDEILALKGVGEYTAAAISSFAFDEAKAVVDGNVYRLLSRLFGIKTPIDSTLGKKEFKNLADALINTKQPALHNQAIMEFGSQYCKPQQPNCSSCVFIAKCRAAAEGTVTQLPVKEKKTKIKTRYFNYLILVNSKKEVIVQKRIAGDIWQGLYEFVVIETKRKTPFSKLEFDKNLSISKLTKPNAKWQSKEYKQILSHQHLFVRFYLVDAVFKPSSSIKKVSYSALQKLPLPRLIEKFMTDCDLEELL